MLSGRVSGERELARAFSRFSAMADDMSDPNEAIAREAAESAIELAPVLSGELASTILANSTRTEATVTAGAGIEYAGVQDQGWPARGIEGTHYMDAAQATAEREAPAAIDDELEQMIRLAHLGRF